MPMQISFALDAHALGRRRCLDLRLGRKRYSIPSSPEYQPALDFWNHHRLLGYPFTMLDLLHAAAIKMLVLPKATPHSITLFATGGLYLALDQTHEDLAIHNTFGDFTAGFSHQFGVALAIMTMSEAYSIPWDQLTPIPVRRKRTLDYEAPIPDGSGWLRLEAKGVTTSASRSSARNAAYRKKLIDPKTLNSSKKVFSEPTAMLGVITQAARIAHERGLVEIIDPEFDLDPRSRHRDNQVAGRYLHYAGVARFAGLNAVADEFTIRARALVDRQSYGLGRRQKLEFRDDSVFVGSDRRMLGLQWRLGQSRDSETDVWFYHGVDLERIRTIVEENEFRSTRPFYHPHEFVERETLGRGRYVENLLPDGSYFGLGLGPRDGPFQVNEQDIFGAWPGIANIS